MLDVKRLLVLRAVVEAGSITAAAERLGFTPSAVSQNVSLLEKEAKIPLFEKSGRGLRPTQAALLLAEHAQVVHKEMDSAQAALEALRAGQCGRLRLVAFATAGAALVPQALARFRDAIPEADIDLQMAETDDALIRLRAGQIDLAIVAVNEPSDERFHGLHSVHLLDDPYRVVLPKRPGDQKKTISLIELKDLAWINTESARCNCLEVVTTACARAGFTPNFSLQADEFATTLGFVGAGLGVSMVPALALSSPRDDVRVLRVTDDEPKRYVFAVARPSGEADPLVSEMIAALTESAESYVRSVV